MARQSGPTFLSGTFDGFSFYYDRLHGYLVRRTGGVTSGKYFNDPRYAAARDAKDEFAVVAQSGKLIRAALADFLPKVHDGTMVNRLTRELVALKELDTVNDRGKRRADVMMADAAANVYFRIFQFNAGVKLYDLTERFPIVDVSRQELCANDVRLKPSSFPDDATHAGLTLVRTVIDFEQGSFVTHSSRMAVVASGGAADLSVVPANEPLHPGVELACIQVLFFRKVKGDLVQLAGKVHAMGVVSVRKVRV